MFLERGPQVVGWHKELGVTKGFQRANTQDHLLPCSFSGIDLPIELVSIKFSWLRFYTIPVSSQANELKWVGEQCLQDVRASNPSAATCGKRKLIPSSVERRGSIGRCCHASVRGCVACFNRTSSAIGTVRKLTAPTPRAMFRRVFREAFSVFCMPVLLWTNPPRQSIQRAPWKG